MKAIIENKVYDTETAERIGFWENMRDNGNFRYKAEQLFRTKKGSFFLHAEGGSMTELARHEGNTTYGGEEIHPLTPAQALEWCSQTGNHKTALKYFSNSLEEA
jgi:hypothetical protein